VLGWWLLVGVLLLVIPAVAGATEVTPPSSTPTATPMTDSSSAAETAPTADPAPTPEVAEEAEINADTVTDPGGEPGDQPEAPVDVTPTGGADKSPPPEPTPQFDLAAYPEYAELPAKQKWRTFKEALRGLLVWDFFDGRLTIRASARVQVDGTLARADSSLEQVTGPLGDSLKLRRLEAFAQGTIDHHLRYSISFNFGADPGFGGVFVEGREQGLDVFGYRIGQFRIGSFQEPFSFERVMSSYYTGFLERSLPVWTFTPGNNIGYMVHDTARKKRLTWAVGFFSFGQKNESNASNSVLSVTSRVTWLPMYRDGGKKLFHVGASLSSRNPSGSNTRYRSRPEARFVNFFVDTGEMEASKIGLYGVEIAAMNGPFSLQSELIGSEVAGTEYGSLSFWGGYLEVGYFLTADHRSYDTNLGVFSKVIPKHEKVGLFNKKPGGALELTGRISNVDLDDGGLNGGQLLDYSFGVNWYLNATSAVKFNYIYSNVKDNGHANVLLLRYQFRPVPVPGWR